jgi:hypothetical protein
VKITSDATASLMLGSLAMFSTTPDSTISLMRSIATKKTMKSFILVDWMSAKIEIYILYCFLRLI